MSRKIFEEFVRQCAAYLNGCGEIRIILEILYIQMQDLRR